MRATVSIVECCGVSFRTSLSATSDTRKESSRHWGLALCAAAMENAGRPHLREDHLNVCANHLHTGHTAVCPV
eukprot:COSAG02_NODE_12206_length_1580_cov_2.939230_3_plen_73_part_00